MGQETLTTIEFDGGFINDGRRSDPELWTVLRADIRDNEGNDAHNYVVARWFPGQASDDDIISCAKDELGARHNLGQTVSHFSLRSVPLSKLQEEGIVAATSVIFIEQ